MRRHALIAVALTIAALGFRLFLAWRLPNDDDDDGRFYAQIARNVLDHRGYSGEEEEPYVPTYVRVPGYPLFLAGVYSLFGRDSNTAARVIQAALDVATCWLAALLAVAWAPVEWSREKRRRAMLIALALAAACPFTAIYITTILTEAWAMLLVTAFVLVATLAFKAGRRKKSALLWLAAGLLGGVATMFRPDCALFLGGAGVMLLTAGLARAASGLSRSSGPRVVAQPILATPLLGCIALTIGFASALAPWTIRNARVFGVFQPVAPPYANMPDEFAPLGYIAWLRTWVDDGRYVGIVEDCLNLYPIPIERIPDYAFDSSEERTRVQSLLDLYNNPLKPVADPPDEDNGEPAPAVMMTPEIDAQFGQMARERVTRHPLRYYVGLPLKRAASLWFDTHTQYYPFQGQLFPLYDLDTDAHQQYWLSLFAALTWLYTIAALFGARVMWKGESSRRWVCLLALLILPRLAFLAAQEHPEPRYTVEFFPLVAAAGGLALACLTLDRIRRRPARSSARRRTSEMKKYIAVAVLLTLAGLGFRLFLALRLPTDEPDDGRIYARLATNLLEHRGYSIETEEPYSPTFIRVPGYPLFIAGVYAVFGRDNNRAVRVVQAVLDTVTCWLIALLAMVWAPPSWSREKRRRLLLIALGMAAACPFPAIYVATILTETCTTLLATGCVLAASLAMNSVRRSKSVALWALAGSSGGLATMFRSDSGLFIAAVGFTLALVGLSRALWRRRTDGDRASDVLAGGPRQVLVWTFVCGIALSVGVAAALAPWTIRNERVFGKFQPVAPQYANMPGEFVPRGYIGWLRTWVDDAKYTELLEFPLDVGPLHIEHAPDYAFDSTEEREQVAALFERYNGTPPDPKTEPQQAPTTPDPNAQEPPAPSKEQATNAKADPEEEDPEEEDPEEADPGDEEEPDSSDSAEEARPQVEMTPEIDAGFAEIARARIARHPFRYFLIVPLKRAASMWFDTHSQYYPFQGELLPLSALDHERHQQYWLPLLDFLTLLYTVLAAGGAWLMWRDRRSRRWLLLLGLLIIPRLAFLSSLANPEPRYVVGFFAFVIAAGSLWFTDLVVRHAKNDEHL